MQTDENEAGGTVERARAALARQKADFIASGPPSAAVRRDRLDRLAALLVDNEAEIVESLSCDFGGRSRYSTRVGDILGGVQAIRFNRDNVERWMQPQPVALPPAAEAQGMRAEVRHQPLGVLGVVVPWNGPMLLACLGAAGGFAAGNRVMLKMPELTPRTSALAIRLVGRYFSPLELFAVEGGPEIGAGFCGLTFDHLLFTGGTAIAREVMRIAGPNLVPVTLELGGRNPVIVGRSAEITRTAARLVTGKLASAGQVCVSPDHLYVPRGSRAALVDAMLAQARELYPDPARNEDYTAVISPRHRARLQALLYDARKRGATVIESWTPSDESVRFPFCIVLEPTDDMHLMQEEIFGPILPIIEYDDLESVFARIAAEPAPLSAYYFGDDGREREQVLSRVAAGNMVVDDVRCQLFFEQLPFGGVGASGHGRYRGEAGFRTFSNPKTIVYQTPSDEGLARLRPPFSAGAREAVASQIAGLRQRGGTPRQS